ncbi:MAG: hypothetical protein ACK418_03160 [Pseudomonas sp.]|uniref:hypothetical protein n=1 Tax=Pseudomonas sp. TaxID=306 RepID=UPI00391A2377
MISSLGGNAANQAQLDAINVEKGRKLVDESRKSAEQELTTAKASRIKTLRYP